MPAGDLVVTGYWTGETKDRLVGLQLDQELQRILDLIAIGGILMIISACIGFRERPPTKNDRSPSVTYPSTGKPCLGHNTRIC
jgi:hypothetical protein